MPKIKNDNIPAVPAPVVGSQVSVPTLTKTDLAAIEIARAYLAFHGKIAPDVISDTVVKSAQELGRQLGWKD